MIKNRLSILLGERRMKVADLARITGINYKTLHNFYHAKTTRIDFETIDKICWALECTTQELLEYSDSN